MGKLCTTFCNGYCHQRFYRNFFTYCWISLGLLIIDGMCINVSVTIPQAARIMDTVTLQCKYNLEGEPLYTVKWYKGQKEFYRYIPKEYPSTQVFPLQGINVDIDRSNPNEVVLMNVRPEITGKYQCEVSSDIPHFDTSIVSGFMYVVDIPDEDPIIHFEKDLLDMGYMVRGNCSSPPSYPPANITWLLNNKKINETTLRRIPVTTNTGNAAVSYPTTTNSSHARDPHPVITVSGVELEIDSGTFVAGKARLQCIASVFNVYQRQVEMIVEEEKPLPRPSSELRTRDPASDETDCIAPSIPLLLVNIFSFLLVVTLNGMR